MTEPVRQETPARRRLTRLIRLPEVQHRVGLGRSTIYRWMEEGKFPRPAQLGGYAVAWAEDEVERWIEASLQLRDESACHGRPGGSVAGPRE